MNKQLQWLQFVMALIVGAENGAGEAKENGATKLGMVLGGIEGAATTGLVVPPPHFSVSSHARLVSGIVQALNTSGVFKTKTNPT